MYMVTATRLTRRGGDEKRLLTLSEIVCPTFSSLLRTHDLPHSQALALAMSRDGSSGGVIRMCVITEDKVERLFVPGDQLPKFWEGREIPGGAVKKLDVDTIPMAVEA